MMMLQRHAEADGVASQEAFDEWVQRVGRGYVAPLDPVGLQALAEGLVELVGDAWLFDRFAVGGRRVTGAESSGAPGQGAGAGA